VFGLSALRTGQPEAVAAVLAGKRDVCVYLPTGGGKSLCYQLPAVLKDGVVLVVSPLIALMADQCAALCKRGVRAAFLSSSQPARVNSATLAALNARPSPQLDLLYVAPEGLPSAKLLASLERLASAKLLTLLAVDEAHCVSSWGHDFRPAFLRIGQVRERLPGVPLMVCSATASAAVRKDLVAQLHLRGPPLEVHLPFDRPEISFSVMLKDAMPNEEDAYAHLLRQLTSSELGRPDLAVSPLDVAANFPPSAGSTLGFVRASCMHARAASGGGSSLSGFAQSAAAVGVPTLLAPAKVSAQHCGPTAIVYCATRDACSEIASRLCADGVRACAYHAGLNASARTAAQTAWARDEVQVVVATVAFGMGIDKPNVRMVSQPRRPPNDACAKELVLPLH